MIDDLVTWQKKLSTPAVWSLLQFLKVFDSDGELVGWMEAWQDDATGTTCGVKIAEKLPVHDDAFGGAFEVRMELGPAGLFGCPSLNILSAKLHMKDELITRISGQPCLLENLVKLIFINLI